MRSRRSSSENTSASPRVTVAGRHCARRSSASASLLWFRQRRPCRGERGAHPLLLRIRRLEGRLDATAIRSVGQTERRSERTSQAGDVLGKSCQAGLHPGLTGRMKIHLALGELELRGEVALFLKPALRLVETRDRNGGKRIGLATLGLLPFLQEQLGVLDRRPHGDLPDAGDADGKLGRSLHRRRGVGQRFTVHRDLAQFGGRDPERDIRGDSIESRHGALTRREGLIAELREMPLP